MSVSGAHPSRLALDRLALGTGDAATRAHVEGCAQCATHLAPLKVQTGQPDFVHPSALALDRFALGTPDAWIQGHVGSCPQCTAHLKAVQVELPVPNWVKELESAPRAPRFAWLRPAFAFAAMAAVLAFAFVLLPRSHDDGGITAKGLGTPQLQVWVNRAGSVSRWDGRALHPNDAFRFEVRPGSFSHLTVVELQEGKLFRVLHSAPVSSDGLSPAWSVDADGTQEEVVVLLSKAPLSEEELQRALAGEGSVWSNHLKFPKEVR